MANDLTSQNIQDSYQRVIHTDGTNTYNGTGSILPISFNGNNVIISGSLTAQTYVVSESIVNVSSGSTMFGNSSDDTHTFTGEITGSDRIIISGSAAGNAKLILDDNGGDASVNFKLNGIQKSVIGYDQSTALNKWLAGTSMNNLTGITMNSAGDVGIGVAASALVKLNVNGSLRVATNIDVVGKIAASDVEPGIERPDFTNSSGNQGFYLGEEGNNTKHKLITFFAPPPGDDVVVEVLTIGDTGDITASGNISGSGILYASASSFIGNSAVFGGSRFYLDGETGNPCGVDTYITNDGENNFVKFYGADTLIAKLHPNAITFEAPITSSNILVTGSGTSELSLYNTAADQRISGSSKIIFASPKYQFTNDNLNFSGQTSFLRIDGDINVASSITASGDVSASGNVYATGRLYEGGSQISTIYSSIAGNTSLVTLGTVETGNVTAILPDGIYSSSLQTLGNITSSGNISASGDLLANNLILDDSSRVDIKFTGFSEDHYIRKDGDFLRFRGHDDTTVLFELKNNSNGNNITSFPNGNHGIGTTNPGEKLVVAGNISASGNIITEGHITASGNIIVSGEIEAENYKGTPVIITQFGNYATAVQGPNTDYHFPHDQGLHAGIWSNTTNDPTAISSEYQHLGVIAPFDIKNICAKVAVRGQTDADPAFWIYTASLSVNNNGNTTLGWAASSSAADYNGDSDIPANRTNAYFSCNITGSNSFDVNEGDLMFFYITNQASNSKSIRVMATIYGEKV